MSTEKKDADMSTVLRLVPAYLVEWTDKNGDVVKRQTASEYPLTQLANNPLRQRLAMKVMGRDFAEAHESLKVMLEESGLEVSWW